MHKRYIENTLNTKDIDDFLEPHNLQRLLTTEIEHILARLPAFPVTGHSSSIYHGQTGVLYLLFHIHNLDPSFTVAGDPVAELCVMYLTAVTKSIGGLDSKHCGFIDSPVGVLALAACVYHVVLRRDYKARFYVEKLLEYQDIALKDQTSDELMYGRAGYLYALELVRLHCRDLVVDLISDQMRLDVVQKIIDSGHKGAVDDWPLMWSFHNRQYIGAAHGAAGIIGVLLQCGPLVDEWKEELLTVANNICQTTLPNNNVPPHLGSKKDELVQFCHGVPGIIPCIALIARLYPSTSNKFLSYAENFADCIWHNGLLRKSVGLCHGISGNAFAFLELYLMKPQSIEYLHKAAAFCQFATDWREHTLRKILDTPDRPYSLYGGNAGLAWLLIDLWRINLPVDQLTDVKERPGGFPCFTDLI
ncbi:hypothetical protein NQZ79_g2596 [Umbelopsis isabellina]|nr:hypothetical protein NQZ79_g2596 [Umbelopsis isabellina]